jgi:hypothetical protein
MRFERIEFTEMPNYGDIFSLEDWMENVKVGGFIDYDGFGNLATKGKMSELMIKPSYVKNGKITIVCFEFDFDNTFPYEDEWKFTHVIWFNR